MTSWRGHGNVEFVASRENRVGVYPGTFNPPTRAHIEIAHAAREAHGLTRIDLAVSTVPFGKDHAGTASRPTFAERLEVIRASVASIPGVGVVVTEHRYIADIADGYAVVVMGADKWHQVNDPVWYDHDPVARDQALARLPDLALVPRPPHEIPDAHRLAVSEDLLEVSSTAARAGRTEWMTPAAREFHARTRAWDPDRA